MQDLIDQMHKTMDKINRSSIIQVWIGVALGLAFIALMGVML